MSYYTTRHVEDGDVESVTSDVVEALRDAEFALLCDEDALSVFQDRLGVAQGETHRLVGVCDAPLAEEALDANPERSVLLPVTVAVYEDDDGVAVSAVDPEALFGLADDTGLSAAAADTGDRLADALDDATA